MVVAFVPGSFGGMVVLLGSVVMLVMLFVMLAVAGAEQEEAQRPDKECFSQIYNNVLVVCE